MDALPLINMPYQKNLTGNPLHEIQNIFYLFAVGIWFALETENNYDNSLYVVAHVVISRPHDI